MSCSQKVRSRCSSQRRILCSVVASRGRKSLYIHAKQGRPSSSMTSRDTPQAGIRGRGARSTVRGEIMIPDDGDAVPSFQSGLCLFTARCIAGERADHVHAASTPPFTPLFEVSRWQRYSTRRMRPRCSEGQSMQCKWLCRITNTAPKYLTLQRGRCCVLMLALSEPRATPHPQRQLQEGEKKLTRRSTGGIPCPSYSVV